MPNQLAHIDKIEKALLKRHGNTHRSLSRISHQAKKFLEKNALKASDLRQKSTQILASAGLTGALLFSPPTATPSTTSSHVITQKQDFHASFTQSLGSITPHFPTKLDESTAKPIEEAIYENTGIKAKAVLEDQQLNHQIGYIGYEQHLQRFPGDNISLHDEEQIAGI